MPTFLVFKSGNKVKELVGANPGALQVSPILQYNYLLGISLTLHWQSLIAEAAANA